MTFLCVYLIISLPNKLKVSHFGVSELESKTLEQIGGIIRNSLTALSEGEIDYFEYVLTISQAYEMKANYYNLLNKYNQTVVEIEKYIARN